MAQKKEQNKVMENVIVEGVIVSARYGSTKFDDRNKYRFSIKSFINPAIVSIFIGLILFISRIKLPVILNLESSSLKVPFSLSKRSNSWRSLSVKSPSQR